MQKEKDNKHRIGFMGSAGRGRKLPVELLELARQTGEEIAKNNCILITGACMGTPQEAATGARKYNGKVFGFSPASDLKQHTSPPIDYPVLPAGSDLIFTGMGKEGRIVLAIMNCDAVIFCAGSAGTLNEFASAFQRGKVIGILKNSGGITDELSVIADKINKNTGAILLEDSDPSVLVRKVIEAL